MYDIKQLIKVVIVCVLLAAAATMCFTKACTILLAR